MARSINEIYDVIISEKENRSSLDELAPQSDNAKQLLNDLTSDSKVAIWRLWAYITAVIIHTHELMWDIFRKDVERIVASAPAGTPGWYHKKVLEYQHGDALVYVENQYRYDPVDITHRIVVKCAVEERPDGVVIIKVAKDDGAGLLPLTIGEKDGLISYVNKIKFAGTRTSIFTSTADSLKIQYDLYYDPIVPLLDLIPALDEALLNYTKDIPFNGAVNVNQITDVLQGVRGVKDPVFKQGELITGIGGVGISFDVEVQPPAGYVVFIESVATMFNFKQKL